MTDVHSNSKPPSILQCSLLLWLDENFDAYQDQYQTDLQVLQELINDAHTFSSREACVDFMTDVEGQKIFLIISEVCAQTIMQHIHDIADLHRVYILSYSPSDETTWSDVWPKIRGIFKNISSICESIDRKSVV